MNLYACPRRTRLFPFETAANETDYAPATAVKAGEFLRTSGQPVVSNTPSRTRLVPARYGRRRSHGLQPAGFNPSTNIEMKPTTPLL